MICRPHNQPTPSQDLDAMVAWMDSTHPLAPAPGLHAEAHDAHGAGDGHRPALPPRRPHAAPRQDATELALNEIGRVTLRATAPLFADDYRRNRVTGSFVLIDEATNQTAAAGMLRTGQLTVTPAGRSGTRRRSTGTAAGRRPGCAARRCGSPGCPGPGKSTLADAVAERAARQPAGRRTCSTATTSATGSTPTSGSRPPTGPRTSAASARWPG